MLYFRCAWSCKDAHCPHFQLQIMFIRESTGKMGITVAHSAVP